MTRQQHRRCNTVLVFLSHASKNKNIALKLVSLLEDSGDDVNVFCSSDEGAIPIGKNFVDYIYKKIDESDVFLPLLTEDYYKSRFCMIELGTAISYIYQKDSNKAGAFICPFSVDPVTPNDALDNTPITHIEVADIFNKAQMRNFIKHITKPHSLLSAKIDDFIQEMTAIIIENKPLIDRTSNIRGYSYGEGVVVKRQEDFINCISGNNKISTVFNFNPYELDDPVKPNFVSTVLHYTDGLDLLRYFKVYPNAYFKFGFNNFTNSLKRIRIELKYGDNNTILGNPAVITINEGEGDYGFSLEDYKFEKLRGITQICFVVQGEDVVEDEGSFIIDNVRVE